MSTFQPDDDPRTVTAAVLVFFVTLWLLFVHAIQGAESPTLKAWQRLRLMQYAGQVRGDWEVSGGSKAAELARLEKWAGGKGFILAQAHIYHKNVRGHSQQSRSLGWVILIDRDLSPNWQFTTLCHEIGHAMTPKSLNAASPLGEVFAELVSVEVADGIGLDVWTETASYLYAFATDEDQAQVINKYAGEIDHVSGLLVKASRGL